MTAAPDPERLLLPVKVRRRGDMLARLRAAWIFFARGLTGIHRTQALFPSSRFLVRAMLSRVPWETARTVVELGPGTGVMTDLILRRLHPEGRLYTIDLDEELSDALRRRIDDPRVVVIHGNAAQAPELIAAHGATGPADAVISSLGLSMIPPAVREEILRGVVQLLREGGLYTQFAYVHTPFAVYNPTARPRWSRFDCRPFVSEYFSRTTTELVTMNLPPATVYTCIKEGTPVTAPS